MGRTNCRHKYGRQSSTRGNSRLQIPGVPARTLFMANLRFLFESKMHPVNLGVSGVSGLGILVSPPALKGGQPTFKEETRSRGDTTVGNAVVVLEEKSNASIKYSSHIPLLVKKLVAPQHVRRQAPKGGHVWSFLLHHQSYAVMSCVPPVLCNKTPVLCVNHQSSVHGQFLLPNTRVK